MYLKSLIVLHEHHRIIEYCILLRDYHKDHGGYSAGTRIEWRCCRQSTGGWSGAGKYDNTATTIFLCCSYKSRKVGYLSDFLNKLPSPFCYLITTKTRCVDAHDVIMCLSNYVYFVKSICTLKCLLLFFTYVSNSHWIDKYLATTWLKPLSLL